MMAEADAKSVLDKISQGHLECLICRSRYTEPKILDCLHSFCLRCLIDLVNNQGQKKDHIVCPYCRQITALPDTGVEGLKNSFSLKSLVEEFIKQEQLLEDTTLPTVTCDECVEGLEAVSRCLDCDANICQVCQVAHLRSKRTNKHRIVKLETLVKEKGVSSIRARSARKCTAHDEQEVTFYCGTCDMLTCAKCAATEHRTENHDCTEIPDALTLYRQNVEETLQKFEESKVTFQAAQYSIIKARDVLKMLVSRTCRNISAKEETEIAKVKAKSQALREEATRIGRERDEEYQRAFNSNHDKMEQAEQKAAAVNNVMEQADEFELLDLKPEVMHNLEFQEELHFEPAKHELSFIDVKLCDVVSDAKLGELILEEKWQLQRKFGKEGNEDGEFKFGRGVACFSNGDIVVADVTSKRVSVFTSSGDFKSMLGKSNGEGELKSPFGVAMTPDDLLLVTDGKSVKIYDANQQYIRQFTPTQADVEAQSKSGLRGIAVDKKSRAAVADKGRKVITLHNLDGSLINTISSSMVDLELAISNKEHVIFTNYDDSRLICVDFTGHEVFDTRTSVNGRKAKPTGVCCDDAGDIYMVCHYNKEYETEVLHYDSEGVYIGCIIQKLQNPLDLTFTHGGNLVVADKHSVQIFERV